MVVREGYKLTEVGVVPEDWEVVELNDLGSFYKGKGVKKTEVTDSGFDCIRYGQLYTQYSEVTEHVTSKISLSTASNSFELKEGDVLFAGSGEKKEEIGKSTVFIGKQTTYAGGDIVILRPYESAGGFYGYALNSEIAQTQKTMAAQGDAVVHIYSSSLKGLKIPLPPTQAEQRAIATALGDADAWIRGLEALLAKKRRVKEGVMGELLRPGAGWRTVLLGEVANIKTGSKNNQDKQSNGLYPFYVRSQSVERINQYSYDEEAILVPGEGNIGSIFHYINGKFEVHQRVYKVSQFLNKVSGKYVFYQMKHRFGAVALENSVKATVDSLRLPTFQEFPLPLPPTLEAQLDIVVALDNIHNELKTIQAKLTKARALKSAMMQELLTGKIRLV